jgi:4-amino-4-deoxy-L-arabinose transferase-like glycosyltransferase
MGKIISWIKKNKTEFWLLLFILVAAAVCRLYKIDQYMTFLGDEGRDVIIVRRIFTELHPPLIGPGTSVGNMYLGPLYYYMMAPALLLANFSPVGPAIQVALLGVITVGFIWWVGKEWFSPKGSGPSVAGLVAAALYAISPTVIRFSSSSWNPNIMPFFALLSIYSIWRVWKKHEFNWLIALGISFAFVMQSHYLGFLLIPTIVLFWVLTLRSLKSAGRFMKKSGIALLSFLFLMSPLLIFDIRHNFQNAMSFEALFTSRGDTVSFNLRDALSKIPKIFNQINITLLGGKNIMVGLAVSIAISAIALFTSLKSKLNPAFLVLFSWIGFGLIGFAFYKLPIYDHYFGLLFPAPFLLIGGLVEGINQNVNKFGKILIYLLLAGLVLVNLADNPLRYHPNRQMQRSQEVSRKIITEAGGAPFDLAVLAERNYEDGYRYFLELYGATVLHADKWDQKTIVDQLFVVCEMEESKCDPPHSPKAEIANFGMSKVDVMWPTAGVIIYKLSHTK